MKLGFQDALGAEADDVVDAGLHASRTGWPSGARALLALRLQDLDRAIPCRRLCSLGVDPCREEEKELLVYSVDTGRWRDAGESRGPHRPHTKHGRDMRVRLDRVNGKLYGQSV